MAEHAKSFWEHLDDLRAVLLRVVGVFLGALVLCFCLKEWLFGLVLAPLRSDFVLFRLLSGIETTGEVALINTSLTGQFMMHVKVSIAGAVALVLPYALCEVGRYLSPALYEGERRLMVRILVPGGLLFYGGVALAYVLVFPLAFRFLASYSVSEAVTNMISLESYVDNLTILCLMMGVLFELPVVAWVLSRLGIVDGNLMRRYRRHALLAILTIVAVITPTTDVLTLLLVSLPIYLLYEISIWTLCLTGRKG